MGKEILSVHSGDIGRVATASINHQNCLDVLCAIRIIKCHYFLSKEWWLSAVYLNAVVGQIFSLQHHCDT